jgi:hypothetical protein
MGKAENQDDYLYYINIWVYDIETDLSFWFTGPLFPEDWQASDLRDWFSSQYPDVHWAWE